MNDAGYRQLLEVSKGDTPPPGMALKPATVTTPTGTAAADTYALIDGDTAATPVQSLIGTVDEDQRVMVLFWPPHGAYIIGSPDSVAGSPTGSVVIKNEGVALGTFTTLDVVGPTLVATLVGTDATITAPAQIAGNVDVLAGLVTQGLRAASSNPPLDLGTGALTAGATLLGGTTTATRVAVDSSGRMGIGVGVNTARQLSIGNGQAHPGTATSLVGIGVDPLFPSTTTVRGDANTAFVRTAAAAFTLAIGTAYRAFSPQVGAGSAITNQYGYNAQNQGAAGVTNAYGINIEAQSGAGTLNVGARVDASTTCALWLGGSTTSTTVAGGIAMGSGRDVAWYRSGAAAAAITGSLAVSGNFAANGVAPAARTTYTQTYSTASATVANMTAAAVDTSASALASYGYTQAQADSIPVAINALIADVTENKKNITSIIDALQAAGIAA